MILYTTKIPGTSGLMFIVGDYLVKFMNCMFFCKRPLGFVFPPRSTDLYSERVIISPYINDGSTRFPGETREGGTSTGHVPTYFPLLYTRRRTRLQLQRS